jgi:hypothetical protein
MLNLLSFHTLFSNLLLLQSERISSYSAKTKFRTFLREILSLNNLSPFLIDSNLRVSVSTLLILLIIVVLFPANKYFEFSK